MYFVRGEGKKKTRRKGLGSRLGRSDPAELEGRRKTGINGRSTGEGSLDFVKKKEEGAGQVKGRDPSIAGPSRNPGGGKKKKTRAKELGRNED